MTHKTAPISGPVEIQDAIDSATDAQLDRILDDIFKDENERPKPKAMPYLGSTTIWRLLRGADSWRVPEIRN